VNSELSLWDLRYYNFGLLAFIMAQMLLIFKLLITKRRRKLAEKSLLRKSEELDRFFNLLLDLLCIENIDGYFQHLNPAWEKTLGYSQEEIMSKRFFEFVHPDNLLRTQDAFSTLTPQRKVIYFEKRYCAKDGTYRWLQWTPALAGDLIFAAARDVTDRLKVEAEVRKRREDDNVGCPHMSLGYMAPSEFASHSGDIPGMAATQNAGNSHSPWT